MLYNLGRWGIPHLQAHLFHKTQSKPRCSPKDQSPKQCPEWPLHPYLSFGAQGGYASSSPASDSLLESACVVRAAIHHEASRTNSSPKPQPTHLPGGSKKKSTFLSSLNLNLQAQTSVLSGRIWHPSANPVFFPG